MAQFDKSKTFNTEKFISCVRLRPVIWDQTSEEYSNKGKKQNAWLEVCREMYDCFDDFDLEKKNDIGKRVLKKWKNLRNCFAREVRKRKVYNSSNVDHKKYIFYDNLSFLEVNLQNSNVSNVDDDDEDTTLQSSNQEKLPKRQKKDKFSDAKSLSSEVQHKNVDSSKSKIKEQSSDDPDRLFMLSLVNELHEIPLERKFQAKCEIMAVISKYKNLVLPPQNPYYPSNLPYICGPLPGQLPYSFQLPYYPQQFQYNEPSPSQQPKKRPFSPWTTSDESASASSDIDFG